MTQTTIIQRLVFHCFHHEGKAVQETKVTGGLGDVLAKLEGLPIPRDLVLINNTYIAKGFKGSCIQCLQFD